MQQILNNSLYAVLDDVIPQSLQKEIYDTLDNKVGEFDWYYYDETIPVDSNHNINNTIDTGQFVHIFFIISLLALQILGPILILMAILM